MSRGDTPPALIHQGVVGDRSTVMFTFWASRLHIVRGLPPWIRYGMHETTRVIVKKTISR